MSERCYHCGDSVYADTISLDQHAFCCRGCVSVYSLLKEHHLQSFYKLESFAGNKPKADRSYQFEFLDLPEIRKKQIVFENQTQAKVTFYLPEIHCSSCIYLLENSPKLNPAIKDSFVNFTKKEASFTFDPAELKLSELAIFLDRIGYKPNFGNRAEQEKKSDKQFLYKIGVAGFAFGSIMLWSFPEYLGIQKDNPEFRNLTSYLSLLVSLPVLFFSARDYFVSAFKALKTKSINLDVPITIGIIALYAQSLWSILNHEGPGYMDSFSGFIFFLLIGKWFQKVSYKSLSFERDYTSYFPVAITKMDGEKEVLLEIEKVVEGDLLLIRNEEIIPCDSILCSEEARLDLSFVSGESNPVDVKKDDFIYAGAKLQGQSIRVQVKNKSNRSHLTQLWNQLSHGERKTVKASYQDKLSLYFLLIVLFIALVGGVVWSFIDPFSVTHVVVSVLIVTCPCALALSSPFTLGNINRLLGRNGLYLKNTAVIEQMNRTTDVIFDKTGTLTGRMQQVEFQAESEEAERYFPFIFSAVQSSTHPLAKGIKQFLNELHVKGVGESFHFQEIAGKGIEVRFDSLIIREIKVGSAAFIGLNSPDNQEVTSFVSVNGNYIGKFCFSSYFRTGLKEMISKLQAYQIHVLTGDNEKDKQSLKDLFPKSTKLLFSQSPVDKLNYIQGLQDRNCSVLMIGDGLNDSGALKEATVGIAVSEDAFRFTPASDGIIDSSHLTDLPFLLKSARAAKFILRTCLVFSICYNLFGLYFALSGQLTPLLAAILMPISSITVVFISTFLVLIRKK